MSVFYTGNVWQRKGDVVSLSGDGIGAGLARLALLRFPDARGGAPQYFPQVSFDAGARAARFMARAVPAAQGEAAEILQISQDSVKYRMPETGIYQATLLGKAYYETAYVNLPQLRVILGDDGDTPFPGGLLRLAGSTLCPEGAPQPPQVCLCGASSVYYLTVEEMDPPYALRARLPQDIPCCSYELSVHNGYGDGRCWAQPRPIEVRESFLRQIPDKVFNVKAYGALGQGPHASNDTAAILNAVEAARENGGGVVYFPEGNYQLTYVLDIPRNVEIRGDGKTKTGVTILPHLWDWGELPPRFFHLNGNNYIHDLDISGTRVSTVFGAEETENLVIERCSFTFIPLCGAPSNTTPPFARWSVHRLSGNTLREADYYYNSFGQTLFRLRRCSNIRLEQVSLLGQEMTCYQLPGSANIYIGDCHFEGNNAATLGARNVMAIRSFYQQCLNLGGASIYFAHNTIMNRMLNNRELMTTDCKGCYCRSEKGDSYLKALDVSGMRYELDVRFKPGALKGKMVLLGQGPGAGQMREIAENTEREITLTEPFAVSPEDNVTKAIIFSLHAHLICYRNHFENGATFQSYGTYLGVILDGNTFKKILAVRMLARFIYHTVHFNWYNSFQNNRFFDRTYLDRVSIPDCHADAAGRGMVLEGGKCAVSNLQRSVTIRYNRMEDGFSILLRGDDLQEKNWNDITLQNNQFLGETSRLEISLPSTAEGVYCEEAKS